MFRLLALLLLALLLWLMLEGALQVLRRLAAGVAAPKGSVPPRQAPREVAGEELVRCAACGTHVPRSRALAAAASPMSEAAGASGADLYCSDRCRRSPPLAS